MAQDISTLPGPSAWSVLRDYSRDPLGFMTRCVQQFGDVVPLQLGKERYCLLSNPAHITALLKDQLTFIKAKDLQLLRGLLGNGLLTSEGSFWQRQRRLAQPVFHQQRIHGYGAVMVDYTQQMLNTWQAGEVRNIHDEMMRLTLNIVMKTLFDQDTTDAQAQQVAQALEASMNWAEQTTDSVENLTALLPQSVGNAMAALLMQKGQLLDRLLQTVGLTHSAEADRAYKAAIAQLDQTIYAMIGDRRSRPTAADDLLTLLMQVEDLDDGSRMSDQQLRDEVATLMLAGHETTANTLTWTWLLLATHPQVRTRLERELQTVLNGRAPTIADLPQLPYTHNIVKEAMRLYPPITDLTREATRTCELGGYRIPQGTTLIVSSWVMHRHPTYFEQPLTFNPDRWANDLEKQLPRGVYLPFGDGPRVCIGKSFALMEAVLLLAAIAQRFRLELMPDQTVELQPSITLRPRHGLRLQLQPAAGGRL